MTGYASYQDAERLIKLATRQISFVAALIIVKAETQLNEKISYPMAASLVKQMIGWSPDTHEQFEWFPTNYYPFRFGMDGDRPTYRIEVKKKDSMVVDVIIAKVPMP